MSSSPVGGAEKEIVMIREAELRSYMGTEGEGAWNQHCMSMYERVLVMSERDRVMPRKRQLSDTAWGVRVMWEDERSERNWGPTCTLTCKSDFPCRRYVRFFWCLKSAAQNFSWKSSTMETKAATFPGKAHKRSGRSYIWWFYVTTEAIRLCTSGIPPETVSPLKTWTEKFAAPSIKNRRYFWGT